MVRRLVLCFALSSVACAPETVISLPTPTVSVLPEALDLGEAVGADQDDGDPAERATTETLFVENTGRADLSYELTVSDAGFSIVDPASGEPVGDVTGVLEPGDDLAVDVRFAPPALGEFAGTLTVASNDPDRPSVEVPLQGTGRVAYAPDIEVTPLALDFGDVELGEVGQDFVTVLNLGDAPLTLGTVTQSGAGTFRLASGDPSGAELLPGASLPVLVEFAPVQTGGDSGVLTLRSDDADEPAIDVALQANGGGDFDYPEAIITGCPATADVSEPVPITLSGVDSIDPDMGSLTYDWRLVRRPDAGDEGALPFPDDGVQTTFVVDAAGIWEVTLVVTNASGLPSVPAKCVIDATPVDDVYVELSWAGPTSDLDLHLARDNAPFFSANDVSYCNPNPDWGAAGDDQDDPRLALDDDDGFGPEIITLPVAPDGTYLVRVHHFDDGDDGSVTATVVVFADGQRITEASAVLARNEVWEVGQINWPARTFGTSTTPPFDAGGTRECAP